MNPNPLSADAVGAYAKQAYETSMRRYMYLIGLLSEGGRTFGDVTITDPAERAAFVAHMGQQGALEPLALVSPRIYQTVTNQFARDAAQSMGLSNG